MEFCLSNIIIPVLLVLVTAAVGFFTWFIQRRLTLFDAKIVKSNAEIAEELKKSNACVDEFNKIMLDGVGASLSIGIANGVALRDGKVNGVMDKALDEAQTARANKDAYIKRMAEIAISDAMHK